MRKVVLFLLAAVAAITLVNCGGTDSPTPTGPTVSLLTDAEGRTLVTGSQISTSNNHFHVTFSEAMDPLTVTGTNITLVCVTAGIETVTPVEGVSAAVYQLDLAGTAPTAGDSCTLAFTTGITTPTGTALTAATYVLAVVSQSQIDALSAGAGTGMAAGTAAVYAVNNIGSIFGSSSPTIIVPEGMISPKAEADTCIGADPRSWEDPCFKTITIDTTPFPEGGLSSLVGGYRMTASGFSTAGETMTMTIANSLKIQATLDEFAFDTEYGVGTADTTIDAPIQCVFGGSMIITGSATGVTLNDGNITLTCTGALTATLADETTATVTLDSDDFVITIVPTFTLYTPSVSTISVIMQNVTAVIGDEAFTCSGTGSGAGTSSPSLSVTCVPAPI